VKSLHNPSFCARVAETALLANNPSRELRLTKQI
jgi:hypothetical protein